MEYRVTGINFSDPESSPFFELTALVFGLRQAMMFIHENWKSLNRSSTFHYSFQSFAFSEIWKCVEKWKRSNHFSCDAESFSVAKEPNDEKRFNNVLWATKTINESSSLVAPSKTTSKLSFQAINFPSQRFSLQERESSESNQAWLKNVISARS